MSTNILESILNINMNAIITAYFRNMAYQQDKKEETNPDDFVEDGILSCIHYMASIMLTILKFYYSQ